MKSPFPGMDPFIESSGVWEDFHHSLITEMKKQLARLVPDRYVVRTGERGYLVLAGADDGPREHLFKPDVGIAAVGSESAGATTAVAETMAESAAYSMRAAIDEEFREGFIEIREANGEGRLVTSIELLSPSNKKPGTPGWDLFLRKRQALFLSHSANLVEIDLLRGGKRMPMVDPWPSSLYALLVSRTHKMPYCRVWPAYFDRPLPAVAIPLRKPDADLTLDLQPLVDAVYGESRYDLTIDYTRPVTPPLTSDEQAWLAQQLQKRPATA